MISIRPGFTASTVRDYLAHAKSGLSAVQNADSPVEKFNAYNVWATNQQRTLGSAISEASFTALVASPRYWSLQSVSPADYGSPLNDVINLEIAYRGSALDAAHKELQLAIDKKGEQEIAMVVLDTNVMMWHHSELLTFDWHTYLDERPGVKVIVWIPMPVVDELDSLKSSRGVMTRGGKDYPRRTLAKQALRTITGLFPEPRYRVETKTSVEGPVTKRGEVRLLLDEPGRTRLSKVDAELIDRTADMQAYATRASVMTYDVGLDFSARAQGVNSVLLIEDENLGGDLVSPTGAKRPTR